MRIERQTFPLRRSCGNDERRRFLRIQSRSIWKHPDETDWKHLLPPLIRKTPSCCRVVYALQNAESRNSSCASAPRDNQVRRWRRKDSPSKAVAGNPSTKAATDGRHLAIVRKIFGAHSAEFAVNKSRIAVGYAVYLRFGRIVYEMLANSAYDGVKPGAISAARQYSYFHIDVAL